MSNSQVAPGVVGPFAGMDVPWLLRMRAEVRRDHPFLIWAPFDAPARTWTYGEFHERVGALAAGLAELVAANCRNLRWIAVTSHDAGVPASAPLGSDSFEALFADSADRPHRPIDPLAPCSVQYTSGTTSRPKAVLWTH